MKFLIVLLAVFVYIASAQTEDPHHGPPIAKCPPGEHSVLYCPQKAEPSCDNPAVHQLPEGVVGACGIPQCFCNTPNLRNTKTGKCVNPSDC